MGIVLRGLVEEVVTISQVMLRRGSRSGEGGLNTLGMIHRKSAIDLIGGDVVETLSLVLLGQ